MAAATVTEDLMAAQRLAPLVLSDDERAELWTLFRIFRRWLLNSNGYH
jgi:hypothetical protein